MLHLGVLLAAATSTATPRVEIPLPAGNDQLQVYGAEFASDGSLYVAGTFFGKVKLGRKTVRPMKRGWMDGFVAKIDAKGKVAWAVSTRGLTGISSLAVSPAGGVAVAGSTEHIVGKEDGPATDWRFTATVLVLDDKGNRVARTALPASDRSWFADIAFASDGTLVGCGGYAGTITLGTTQAISVSGPHAPSVDAFVVHLTRTGDVDWSTTSGGAEDDRAEAITLGPNDNIYVAGTLGAQATFGRRGSQGQRRRAASGSRTRRGRSSPATRRKARFAGSIRFRRTTSRSSPMMEWWQRRPGSP